MKKTVSILLIIALGFVPVSLATEDTWTYKADMPTARVFVGGSVINGKIYIIGGAPSGSSVTSTVEMYDPIVDTWTRMANMPSGRCGPATCTFDGKIYVFGGLSPNMWSTSKKNVYVYDPKVDTWTQKADMPYANALCGIAVVDGTIYLIGGGPGGSSPPVPTVMAYDPITETWTQEADMPTPRWGLSACVVDGKIYAIGGAAENWQTSSYKHVEVYDPATDIWTLKSDMPTERYGLSTCVVDGKIYAIGGNSAFAVPRTANEVYDPITDIWAAKSPMQQERWGLFVASVGNKIFAIAGGMGEVLPTVEEYDTGLSIPSPDFNGDGIVDMKDLLRLIESWGQDDPMVDIAPPPFGDGIVDALDLEFLMSYWEQPVEDPSLIAHWAMDETEGLVAYDSAGVNDAFVIGGTAWQPSDGQVDGALQLDGIDGCVIAGPVLNPVDGPFSALTWINGGLPGQVIISQQGTANWLTLDADGNLMTELMATGRSGSPLQTQAIITDGSWHRVGFVWDGFYRSLYLDDILVAEDTQDGLESSNGGLYIGTDKTMAPGTYFSGLIDDIRIYNRVICP